MLDVFSSNPRLQNWTLKKAIEGSQPVKEKSVKYSLFSFSHPFDAVICLNAALSTVQQGWAKLV
jgi:hypothetical protein